MILLYVLKFILSQCLYGTFFLTFVTQNTFCGVISLARIVVHFHIHRTNFQALAALNALLLVAVDAEHGKVTHRLEEDRDRANVLAEGAIIFECYSENNAHHIIDQIPDKENHEHRMLGGFPEMEQQKNKDKGKGEDNVTDEANPFPRTLRLFVRQQVENHGGPTAVAAPTTTEKQWPEDLCDGIMQNARPEETGNQVIPEPLNLHVLVADQSEEYKHVGTHAKLHELTGVFLFRGG